MTKLLISLVPFVWVLIERTELNRPERLETEIVFGRFTLARGRFQISDINTFSIGRIGCYRETGARDHTPPNVKLLLCLCNGITPYHMNGDYTMRWYFAFQGSPIHSACNAALCRRAFGRVGRPCGYDVRPKTKTSCMK